MPAAASSVGRRRWGAVTWPNSPPALPDAGFAGPYALWKCGPGGVFMSYELAEQQGYIDDENMYHPIGAGEDILSATERRYLVWKREYHSGRGETYLKLAGLDLTSAPAIVEWVSTFGVLDIRALDAPPTKRQWYATAAPQSIALRALAHYPGFGIGVKLGPHRIGSTDSTLRDEAVDLCESERGAAPIWTIEETLHEFIFGAEAIRDLVTAWTCLRDGDDPRDQTWANARMPSSSWSKDRAVDVTAEFFEGTLSATLERFSPRIYLRDEDGRRTFLGPSESPAPDDLTLFELMVLEIFRHVAEGASYKRCENENCGMLFVRQEGGAQHGQSRRTGVKYCTRLCAKATAQRAHRRRKAAAVSKPDDSEDPSLP